ncbi:MAG: hypothetical protein M1541_04860 [Acidobacteria bacterium]|nr:hypothetical protein [Acidobacteriota bacterium]
MPKTVCLDFDGVLNTYSGWKGPDELFDPRPGVRVFLEELNARGFCVVLHSTRDPEKLRAWLERYQLDHLVEDVRAIKPPAIAYVDDRGICFRGDYADVLLELEDFRAHWEK